MRTTLTIDDHIAKRLKALAHRSGKSWKRSVNETLEAVPAAGKVSVKARRYRITPVALGGVHARNRSDQGASRSRCPGRRRDRPQARAAQVILVDANILMYAIDRDCLGPRHAA